jgi:hypothetical protein
VLVACPMVLDQEPRLFGLDIADIEGKLEHRIVSPGCGWLGESLKPQVLSTDRKVASLTRRSREMNGAEPRDIR